MLPAKWKMNDRSTTRVVSQDLVDSILQIAQVIQKTAQTFLRLLDATFLRSQPVSLTLAAPVELHGRSSFAAYPVPLVQEHETLRIFGAGPRRRPGAGGQMRMTVAGGIRRLRSHENAYAIREERDGLV
jgi:hypothetical protein